MIKKWQVYYYSKKDGSMPVKEYIDNLALRERAKVMAFIGLLEDRGPNLPRPYADLLEDGIHELRIKLTGTQTRILYFFCYRDIIVLTNAFEKYADRIPMGKMETAKESRADFLARFTEDSIRRGSKNEI
jgi:hypothetical protein